MGALAVGEAAGSNRQVDRSQAGQTNLAGAREEHQVVNNVKCLDEGNDSWAAASYRLGRRGGRGGSDVSLGGRISRRRRVDQTGLHLLPRGIWP